MMVSPNAPLEISGTVSASSVYTSGTFRVGGTGSETCAGLSDYGKNRYNPVTGHMQVCVPRQDTPVRQRMKRQCLYEIRQGLNRKNPPSHPTKLCKYVARIGASYYRRSRCKPFTRPEQRISTPMARLHQVIRQKLRETRHVTRCSCMTFNFICMMSIGIIFLVYRDYLGLTIFANLFADEEGEGQPDLVPSQPSQRRLTRCKNASPR
ncbi:hypothetical protein [Bradyrhizobium sp. CCBAU 51627]|uniref:hypothetical protein n=1 Tax=Bradyrhizobium sp. CCBAU 51627 TaxID=1325088 RepID=UPI0023050CC4|nr:hypothetical protein [Bradyrhizobium sp. CCBAU 51627]